MHELYNDLTDICETLSEELAKTNEKLRKVNGSITAADIDYINKLTHAIKSVKTTKAMMDAEGGGSYGMGSDGGSSYEGSYDGDGSYARGRGRGAKRDSMGRYSRDTRERGYSRGRDMVGELRELMEDAPDERTKMEFQRMISKMESM